MKSRKTGHLSKAAKKDVQMIVAKKLALNSELKQADDNLGPVNITTAGSTEYMDSEAQGTGTDRRVGQRVKAQRLRVRFNAYIAGSTSLLAETYNDVRVIVGQWFTNSQDHGVTANTLLANPAKPITSLRVDQSHYSLDEVGTTQPKRFRVFHDQIYSLGSSYETGGIQFTNGRQSFVKELDIKGPFRATQYNSDKLAPTQEGEGRFFIFWISDSAWTPSPQFNLEWMLQYTDM